MNDQRLVVLAIAVTFAMVTARSALVDRRLPPARQVAGALFVAVALSAAVEVAPRWAGPFAILVMTTTLLSIGPDVFPVVGKGSGITP